MQQGQIPLALQLSIKPSFDNFVVGRNNQVFKHIKEAATGILPTVPTYIWGQVGAGKTHLLQAVKYKLNERGIDAGWLDDKTKGFAEENVFDPNWQAVILDNVERLNEMQQQTAFNWFVNALTPTDEKVRWVLAAGQMPVADLPLREDVRTRLGWGATFALHNLSDYETRSALNKTAAELGLTLSKEVLDYIQRRFARDMGSLTELLRQLDYYALKEKRAVTIALIKKMLGDKNYEL